MVFFFFFLFSVLSVEYVVISYIFACWCLCRGDVVNNVFLHFLRPFGLGMLLFPILSVCWEFVNALFPMCYELNMLLFSILSGRLELVTLFLLVCGFVLCFIDFFLLQGSARIHHAQTTISKAHILYIHYHHKSLRICTSGCCCTCLQRLGISAILLRICLSEILSHSAWISALNWAIVDQVLPANLPFMICQHASMGLRSGDWGGWTSNNSPASRLRCVGGESGDLIPWLGSPSSWRWYLTPWRRSKAWICSICCGSIFWA